ncbi:Por secretion system C-terminal sorting domain-containing protein [Dyadobacter soli]|uniref:Por secretion system C-terminal sorting domain-containing protein n=1 Tax=Dyadobacter soli TaxID=659014 RepID=A0A1G6ZNX2_9BACT|nr:T9SS type A sorting domain-containing protein [Dyadobacter soli]SDE04211.1 Por secretion system C-terminal sorting domain-containing protein [Dyadobacter soli]
MKKLLTIASLVLCAYHSQAQSISPGALYAASASASANGVSVNWVLGTLNSFSELSVLPVKLVSFEGRLNAAGLAELHWKTAEEVNNLGFEIQKSLDGKSWELLGWVDGAVNSNAEKSYQFVDQGFATTSYYRLRQVDMDDSYTYSKIVCVIPEKESLDRFYVYPNPSRDEKVKIKMPERTQRLLLFDQLGNRLGQFEAPGTERTITLPHTGSFLLQIDTPVGSKTTKLIFY